MEDLLNVATGEIDKDSVFIPGRIVCIRPYSAISFCFDAKSYAVKYATKFAEENGFDYVGFLHSQESFKGAKFETRLRFYENCFYDNC